MYHCVASPAILAAQKLTTTDAWAVDGSTQLPVRSISLMREAFHPQPQVSQRNRGGAQVCKTHPQVDRHVEKEPKGDKHPPEHLYGRSADTQTHLVSIRRRSRGCEGAGGSALPGQLFRGRVCRVEPDGLSRGLRGGSPGVELREIGHLASTTVQELEGRRQAFGLTWSVSVEGSHQSTT